MALPKIFRIKKTDFAKIFSRGKTVQNSFFVIYWLKTGLDFNRFAVIVSSRVSPMAVIRNKIRRRVQAVILKNILRFKIGVAPTHNLRQHLSMPQAFSQVMGGVDIIISARRKVKARNFLQLENSLTELLRKANIL